MITNKEEYTYYGIPIEGPVKKYKRGTTSLVTIGLPNMTRMSNINVPVSIKIIDRSAFSLWIDPSKIGNHFGNTPIYGIVTTKSG